MSEQGNTSRNNQSQAAAPSPFREVPPEIQQILDDHQQWLQTEGKEGQKADLSKADLQRLDLSGVNLEKANLQEANLPEAGLWAANIRGADFKGADLRDAKGLTQEQLDLAIIDEHTKLPDYLKKGAKGKAASK